MPEGTAPPADGTTGTETKTETSGTETPATKPEAGKTFTQEQLDAIVTDRVARAKPADYDEAKAALEEKRKRDEGEKTEVQRLTEANQALTQERDSARGETAGALRMAEIRIEALKQGADDELTAMYLLNDTSIEVKDGKVVGAKEAVEKALKDKPNLKVGGIRQSGGEFGGTDQATIAEQIAALERKGDRESLAEARRLKINQQIAAG